jgi:hypothetical protein
LKWKCPHHGFSELQQVDIFYNALMQIDQDSLNTAAGGNIFYRTPKDILTIIENKSKVRTAQNKPVVSSQFYNEKSIGELLAKEKAAKVSAQFCKTFVHDDDDDSIQMKEYYSSVAITPEVPTHSLSMGDEHLDIVPEKESDEFIKSSVEDLVPIPRESQGILEHMCDIPSPPIFPDDHDEMFSDSEDDCLIFVLNEQYELPEIINLTFCLILY